MERDAGEVLDEVARALDEVRRAGKELDDLLEELPASRTGRGIGNLIGRPDDAS